MNGINNVIENHINGNNTTAKKLAKRYGWDKIFKACRDEFGYSEAKARATADYLKGLGSFQAACDAV